MEFPCAMSTLYITGSVLFLLFLQLWYGGLLIIYYDVCVIIFEKVPHIVLEDTSLGHLECWTLWDTK